MDEEVQPRRAKEAVIEIDMREEAQKGRVR